MVEIKKLTGFIGAELSGVNLNGAFPADALTQHLGAHGVLVIRDQHLSRDAQKNVTQIFGPLMRLPYITPMVDDPDVIAVLKEAHETAGGVFGGEWHSDFSFLQNPPAGSILNAVELPEFGGDTVFACQSKAYETLPSYLRDFVDTHDCIHIGKPYGVKYAPPQTERSSASIQMTRGDPHADDETVHPSVLRDPTTGRQALFVNPIYTTRFEGLTDTQSAPLLDQIYKHCTRPDFSYRHRWQAGDVLIWDNRMTLHYATNDYAGQRRLLYRTTFGGKRPVRA